MAEGNNPRKRHADYKAMSTAALEELLRQDLQGNILDVETISVVSRILTARKETEDPDSIPPVDLQWRSFRENYLSIRARLRRFARRVMPKLLIVLGILAAITVIFLFESAPLRTDSLTDLIVLEDGRFTVDGLRRGMTREEVIDRLTARDLPYSEADIGDYVNRQLSWYVDSDRDHAGTSWISIRGNTRLEEMGKLNVRHTYYFEKGLLTSVELTAGPIRGNVRETIRDFQRMVLTAELAYGRAQGFGGGDWTPFDYSRPGSDSALWHGADDSALELIGRYTRELGGIERVFSRDPRAGKMIEGFELCIRVTL